MTTKENYETLKATIEALSVDFEKFDSKKVKAAGQRARNHLLTAKKLCDTLRKQIITEMRELPTRHRISDTESKTESESEETEDKKETEELPPPPELKRETTEAIQSQKDFKTEPITLIKPKRTRKANKRKLTKEDIKDD